MYRCCAIAVIALSASRLPAADRLLLSNDPFSGGHRVLAPSQPTTDVVAGLWAARINGKTYTLDLRKGSYVMIVSGKTGPNFGIGKFEVVGGQLTLISGKSRLTGRIIMIGNDRFIWTLRVGERTGMAEFRRIKSSTRKSKSPSTSPTPRQIRR